MTNYKEEQDGEFEALSSIYSEELNCTNEDPRTFEISLNASGTDGDNKMIEVSATLSFTYTPTYPDERPLVDVTHSDGITDDHINEMLELINEQGDENLGMVMIFTLVSAGQDKLETIIENIKQEREDEKYKIEMARRKEDEKRFHGTPVTLENFLAWRIQFGEEMKEKLKYIPAKIVADDPNKKLTGRQLFERDDTLKDSDAQFYSETGVKVDESLFQDLEDLDIDAELDEELELE